MQSTFTHKLLMTAAAGFAAAFAGAGLRAIGAACFAAAGFWAGLPAAFSGGFVFVFVFGGISRGAGGRAARGGP